MNEEKFTLSDSDEEKQIEVNDIKWISFEIPGFGTLEYESYNPRLMKFTPESRYMPEIRTFGELSRALESFYKDQAYAPRRANRVSGQIRRIADWISVRNLENIPLFDAQWSDGERKLPQQIRRYGQPRMSARQIGPREVGFIYVNGTRINLFSDSKTQSTSYQVRLHWNPDTRVEEIKAHQLLYLAFAFNRREDTITFYKRNKQELDDLKELKATYIDMLQDHYHNNTFESKVRKAVLTEFQNYYNPELGNLRDRIERWVRDHTVTYELHEEGQATLNHVNIGIQYQSDDEYQINRQPFEDDNKVTVYSFTGYHTLRKNQQGDYVPYIPVMGSRNNPIIVDDSGDDMDIQGFEPL